MPEDFYAAAGFNSRTIGYGERPAVLVVDFQNAVTHPSMPMGQSPLMISAVEKTGELLTVAREADVPVIFCTTAFREDLQDMPPWKISGLDTWIEGSWEVEIDKRLWSDGDFLFVKKAPSIFFATPVVTLLNKLTVDTVILTGANTSGCIRASTIDSFSWGYRTILPRECQGDLGQGPHDANLHDVGKRYADVVGVADVVSYLQGLEGGRRQPAAAGAA
jgi:maleamate amidohydrolase